MNMIFPLTLTLIIIAFIVFISKVSISLKKTRPVVILYLALLLVSVPVFYAIAEPGEPVPVPGPDTTDERFWEEYDRRINEFYDAIYGGQLEEYEDATVNGQWSFEYNQERLLVTASDNRYYDAVIAVKRKDVNDGKVDVASYTAAPSFSQTTVANPPEVRLVGNRLEIIRPQPKHVEMVRFFHDFTSAQFTGKELFMENRGFFHHVEQQVLYLRIPPGLIIDTDNSTAHMHYIDN